MTAINRREGARPLLIHIGYHKTGTTFLQRHLFRIPMGFRPIMDHDAVFAEITRPHALDFRPEALRAGIAARCAEPTKAPIDVISSEILSGNPFYGGRDSADIAHRLAVALPEARILITIREQIAAIASVYMQYLRRAGRMTPADFFAEDPAIGYDGFSAAHFHYDRLVSHYRGLFGAERVLVLEQTVLASDPDAFVDRLRDFCGVAPDGIGLPRTREAASYPESAAFILRRINHFRDGPAGPAPVVNAGRLSETAIRLAGGGARALAARGFVADTRPIRDFVTARYDGAFAASNRRLKDMLGDAVDLSGWQLAPPQTPTVADPTVSGSTNAGASPQAAPARYAINR